MEDNVNRCWLKSHRKRCAKIPSVSLFLYYTSILFTVEVLSQDIILSEISKAP